MVSIGQFSVTLTLAYKRTPRNAPSQALLSAYGHEISFFDCRIAEKASVSLYRFGHITRDALWARKIHKANATVSQSHVLGLWRAVSSAAHSTKALLTTRIGTYIPVSALNERIESFAHPQDSE